MSSRGLLCGLLRPVLAGALVLNPLAVRRAQALGGDTETILAGVGQTDENAVYSASRRFDGTGQRPPEDPTPRAQGGFQFQSRDGGAVERLNYNAEVPGIQGTTVYKDEKKADPPPADKNAHMAAMGFGLIGALIGFALGGPIGAVVGFLAGALIGAAIGQMISQRKSTS